MIRQAGRFLAILGLLVAGHIPAFAQPTAETRNSPFDLLKESFAALADKNGVNLEFEISVLSQEGQQVYGASGAVYRSGGDQHIRIGARTVLYTSDLQILVDQAKRTIWYVRQGVAQPPAIPLIKEDLDWRDFISRARIFSENERYIRFRIEEQTQHFTAIDVEIDPRLRRLFRIVYYYPQGVGGSAHQSSIDFRWGDVDSIPAEALDPEHYLTFSSSAAHLTEAFATYELREIGHDLASSHR